MTAAAEQLKPTLAALSSEERLALADWLYEQADEVPDSVTGDPELDRVLKERYEAVMDGTAKGRPGPEVFADLKKRFS